MKFEDIDKLYELKKEYDKIEYNIKLINEKNNILIRGNNLISEYVTIIDQVDVLLVRDILLHKQMEIKKEIDKIIGE